MTSMLTRFLFLLCAAILLPACAAKPIDRQALYLSCSKGKHLLVYEIDPQTGTLSETQRVTLPASPGPIALTDEGKTLYAALRGPDQILPLARDTQTGKLTKLNPTDVPAFPTYLDIDNSGKYAIAASYGSGVVFSMLIDQKTGELHHKPLQVVETARSAHASLIDPSNRFVYIPHTLSNETYQFAFDATSGLIKPLQPAVVKGGGAPDKPAGPRHYTHHPRLDLVYMVNELDSSVSAYAWNQTTGQLQRFQNLTTLPAGFTQTNTCADIHITPDGKFLYASNRGHDSIAAYKLDDAGRMTFIDWFKTEAWPREFAIDLTGRFLYAAGLRSDKLAAYTIDSETGRLARFATYDTPAGPIWVEPAALD